MIDAWKFWQLDCDLHFADIGIFQLFVKNAKVFLDRILNILQSFYLGFAL